MFQRGGSNHQLDEYEDDIHLSWNMSHTVDGSEIRRSPVEVGSWSHYLQGFINPRWCRISEPSTVWVYMVYYTKTHTFCLFTWWFVYGFYHGTSPLNHHLGNMCLCFPTTLAHLRQACQPLQLPLGIRIHHSHDITRLPSGGQSCRLCGAVVRRNTKRLQVPCRKLAVANRHGQVLGGKKHLSISKIVFCNLCTWIVWTS